MTWERARTLTLVTLATILVWVFAEAEGIRSVDTPVEISVEPQPGGDRSVEVLGLQGGPIAATLTLDGSANALDAAVRRLRRAPLTLSPGMDGLPKTPGEHVVQLRDALEAHPEFLGQGVSIKKIEPESLRVRVDELATRDFKVDVAADGAELEDLPQARPPRIKITGPAKLLAAVPEGATLAAQVDPAIFSRLVPGRQETISAIVPQLPEALRTGQRLKFDPPTVDVLLTAKLRTMSVRVASVPVHIRIAPGEMAKFDVDIAEADRSLIDVTVSGPAELVRPIADKSRPLVAEVPLSFEELERGIPSKDAVFSSVPSSLKFDVANRTVRLAIKRRPAPTSPAKPD